MVSEYTGKPVLIMVTIEDYEELQDELDDLISARRVADLYDAWKQDPSTGIAWEEVESELIDDGLLDE